MPTVIFGNTAPIDTEKIDESKDAVLSNLKRKQIAYESSITRFEVPGGTDLPGALAAISAVWWKNHSDDPPEWVESDDEALEILCASYFSWQNSQWPADQGDFSELMPTKHVCRRGRPKDWKIERRAPGVKRVNVYDENGRVTGTNPRPSGGGGKAGPPSEKARSMEIATMRDLARIEEMGWADATLGILASGEPYALKTTNGIDHVARVLGGDRVGETGTATASSTTTLTATGTPFTASSGGPPENGGYVGHIVVADATPQVYGNIIKNSTSVLTIDYWHAPADPGAQASTPGATAKYIILPGGAPSFWMAFSVSADTADVADTFLDNGGSISEIFGTFNSGLARQPVTYAHTLGASTYTLSKQYTAISSDSTGGVTITKIGIFANGVLTTPAAANSGVLLFTTDLSNTATLIPGDQITPTDTITIS